MAPRSIQHGRHYVSEKGETEAQSGAIRHSGSHHLSGKALGFKPTFVGLQINFALTTRRTYQKTHLRGPIDLPRWAIEQGR